MLKNLVNLNTAERQKCGLYASDFSLISELKEKNINFVFDSELEELYLMAKKFSIFLTQTLGIENITERDYSQIDKPIYLGDGVWINQIDKE